jgi:hypothetical protein
MTSGINYSTINAQFPVAGKDNDSQGFRDNFAATKAALSVAYTEISALQGNALLAADLATSSTPVVNDLLQSTISNGIFTKFYGKYYAATNNSGTSGPLNIDLTNGPVQKVILAANVTLTFTNWPEAGQMGLIRLLVSSNQLGVWYPTFQTANAGTIYYASNFPTNSQTNLPGFTTGGESVKSISVTNPGTGFTSPTTITFSGGSPQSGGTTPTATATYKAVSLSLSGGSGGTGFAQGDTLVCTISSDITATVGSVSGGVITSVTLTSGGNQATPVSGVRSFQAATGTGTGCRLTVASGINTITVTNGGDGYTTTPPTVGTSGGSGSGLQATAVLTSQTADNTNIVEAWTIDGGATVFMRWLGEY